VNARRVAAARSAGGPSWVASTSTIYRRNGSARKRKCCTRSMELPAKNPERLTVRTVLPATRTPVIGNHAAPPPSTPSRGIPSPRRREGRGFASAGRSVIN
jgi:hypothetical protein